MSLSGDRVVSLTLLLLVLFLSIIKSLSSMDNYSSDEDMGACDAEDLSVELRLLFQGRIESSSDGVLYSDASDADFVDSEMVFGYKCVSRGHP